MRERRGVGECEVLSDDGRFHPGAIVRNVTTGEAYKVTATSAKSFGLTVNNEGEIEAWEDGERLSGRARLRVIHIFGFAFGPRILAAAFQRHNQAG